MKKGLIIIALLGVFLFSASYVLFPKEESLPKESPAPALSEPERPLQGIGENYNREFEKIVPSITESARIKNAVGSILTKLPYVGREFSLSYDYNEGVFIVVVDPQSRESGLKELDGFLEESGIENRGWLDNLKIDSGTESSTKTEVKAFNMVGATQAEEESFYNILTEAMSFPLYNKLLTERGTINIVFAPTKSSGCESYFQGDTVGFFGFAQCSPSHQLYLALHGSGHIIGNRNGRLYQSFPHFDLTQKDAGCYSRLGFLRSYFHAETGAGTDSKDESFAEAVALFLMPKERIPLTDFQNQCPNTYNWVRNNIFK